jgi:hypothetical protein
MTSTTGHREDAVQSLRVAVRHAMRILIAAHLEPPHTLGPALECVELAQSAFFPTLTLTQ